MVKAEVSTCRKNGLSRFGYWMDGLDRIMLIRVSNADRQSVVQMNGWSFLVRATCYVTVGTFA